VHLSEDVVEMLGAWWGEVGSPTNPETLVFAGETKTGYMNPQVILRREVYPAIGAAGVPRVGPTGKKRTFFHSFRHTFRSGRLRRGARCSGSAGISGTRRSR
jgi:integrase